MCFKTEIAQAKAKSPRSSWRQMIRQPTKPRLSRKVIKSARVNLNRYWSKFEELASSTMPLTSTIDGLAPCIDNEINENILNEWREDRN